MRNVLKHTSRLIAASLLLLLSACNTLKFVPEDKLLLNKTKIVVTDTKTVSPNDLKSYLRQTNNSEILGFWKLQLHIYDTAPKDTTTKSKKRLARNAFKMGEAPEIFNPDYAEASMYQLRRAMQNKGYFDATVDTQMVVKKRKLALTYLVTAHEPYTLREVEYQFADSGVQNTATNQRMSKLERGMLFDSDQLDAERKRITSTMRNKGYYYFEKEMICYTADSTVGHRQVDVNMHVQPYMNELSDSAVDVLMTRYRIGQVYYHIDYDPKFRPEGTQLQESHHGDYHITWTGKQLLRLRTLVRNTEVHPGAYYSERAVEQTYANFNSLGAVKYVDISFVPGTNPQELDCHIVLSRSKLNTFSIEGEGTYSAGDWGVAAGINYANKNIFHGSEELSIGANGSYEWRQNGGRAIEAKAVAGLKFPSRLNVQLEYQYQRRPGEYTRTITNGSFGYFIQKQHSRFKHSFKFVDISYVYLPEISDEFRAQFLQPDNILRYSYEDHFLTCFSYTMSYTSFRQRTPFRPYGNFRMTVETCGNVLNGIAQLCNVQPKEDGTREVFGISYAQYFKADFDFSYHGIINEKHRLVLHGGLGCAIPYGNAKTIPFEKRYFSGGANSVRGWLARALGPGAYRSSGSKIDYNNQSGDVRLDLSMEYRWKVWNFIELAAFTDAGNIWTISDYESQPHGVITKDAFREIAWSYGIGLRLDFNIFVLRFDWGIKLYDPSRIYYDQKPWRTVPNGLNGTDDMAFHFAIGYPF